MKRVLFALCIGAVALGAGSCDDAGPDAGLDGSCPSIEDCSDVDAAPVVLDTATFLVTTDGHGFNLDGQNTKGTSTPIASDPWGCYQQDTVVLSQQGLDARFGPANVAAAAFGLDLGAALGTIRFRVTLSYFHGTTDKELYVALAVDTGSGFVSIGRTATSLTNGISPVFGIDEPLDLVVPVARPDCAPGDYGENAVPAASACASTRYDCTSSLALRLDGVKLQLHVEESSTTPGGYRLVTSSDGASVTHPTMIAGHIRFTDTSVGSARCGATPLTGTTFDASLQKVACDLGLGASWGKVCAAYLENLDLHEDAGQLTMCASGASVATSNANAISFAAYVGD